MVISGINLGANVGVNVLYSGTVSAATEGAFFGIRSAAVSLDALKTPDFRFAARFCRTIIGFMRENGLKDGTALNVNIPAVPTHEISGISITRQGTAKVREQYDRRIDPRGQAYYWLTGEAIVEDGRSDADVNVLKENKITITPITCDLTCRVEMERLRSLSWPDLRDVDLR
jgi:5'-nucleotidase